MRSRLRKLSCTVQSAHVSEGAVQVRLAVAAHSCGSSAADLRTIVEEGVYELAPDVTSLEILGLEEPTAGFVSLDSLMGQRLAAVTPNGRALEGECAD